MLLPCLSRQQARARWPPPRTLNVVSVVYRARFPVRLNAAVRPAKAGMVRPTHNDNKNAAAVHTDHSWAGDALFEISLLLTFNDDIHFHKRCMHQEKPADAIFEVVFITLYYHYHTRTVADRPNITLLK